MDTCVACGEVAEGKPLYKKLGNGGTVEVFDALIEMQLLSLPQTAKNDHIICWDCDEIIAEEYASFLENEKKRKEEEVKRKQADAIRNQKLNKKLKQAFKKVYNEERSAKGISPPMSKYKQKVNTKASNKYFAQQCLLCNTPFKGSKSGYLRFSLKRMVDDSCSVYQALKKLGSDIELEPHVQLRRFVCCLCYNKIRRNYKNICKEGKDDEMSPIHQTYTNGTDHSVAVNSLSGIKRLTADEHAAEIAKLVPPALADVYKVVRQDEPKMKHVKRINSDSDSTDSEQPSKKVQKQFHTNSKGDILSNGVCCVCGLCYSHRPKIFWYSLSNKMPDYDEITVHSALQAVGTDLASVSKQTMDKGLVCKPCFTKATSSYKSYRSQLKPNGVETEPKKYNIKMDMKLLSIINQSRHLRYKGRLVLLRSVDVHVVDIFDMLENRSGRIPTERLKNVYKYSNYNRSIQNKFNEKCILCLAPNNDKHCRWLEDPVYPPHLMVPIRWAKLSLGPSETEANLSTDDGRVCGPCFKIVKSGFMKFVSNKIGLSLNQDEGKVSLKNYKVSFDSVAMSVVADPLQPDEKEEEDDKQEELKESKDDEEEEQYKNVPPMPKSKKQNYKNNFQLTFQEKKSPKETITSPTKTSVPPTPKPPLSSPPSSKLARSVSPPAIESSKSPSPPPSKASKLSSPPTKSSRSSPSLTKSSLTSPTSTKSSLSSPPPVKSSQSSPTPIKPAEKAKPKEASVENITENPKLSLFDQLNEEEFCEGDDIIAPFAQRKKIRTPHTADKKETDIKTCYSSLWQTLQSISLDDLLSSNELQPLKPTQYTVGILLALDEIKDHLGCTHLMVVEWFQKLFPKEYRDSGQKLNKSVVLSYLQKSDKHLNKLSDPIPDNFYSRHNTPGPLCTTENKIITQNKKSEWFGSLDQINIDKLLSGEKQLINNITSKTIYSLWRINSMLNIPPKIWPKWLRSVLSVYIADEICQKISFYVAQSHQFLSNTPSRISVLNVPFVDSNFVRLIVLNKENSHQINFPCQNKKNKFDESNSNKSLVRANCSLTPDKLSSRKQNLLET